MPHHLDHRISPPPAASTHFTHHPLSRQTQARQHHTPSANFTPSTVKNSLATRGHHLTSLGSTLLPSCQQPEPITSRPSTAPLPTFLEPTLHLALHFNLLTILYQLPRVYGYNEMIDGQMELLFCFNLFYFSV
jgi:hypothetical protein